MSEENQLQLVVVRKENVFKRTGLLMLAALVGIGVGFGAGQMFSSGEERVEYAFEKEDAAKACAAIRRMPKHMQAAMIASRYGLIFEPGSTSAYHHDIMYSNEERVQYYAVNREGKFVDFEGNVRRFYDVTNELNRMTQRENWMEVMQMIGATTDEAVFAPMAEEVRELALQAVKYHLNLLSKRNRLAWLTERAHLLFSEDGSNFYNGRVQWIRIPGMNRVMVVREVTDAAKFYDEAGRKRGFKETRNQVRSEGREESAWCYASYAAEIAGTKAVQEMCAKELESLRKVAK